MLLRFGPNELNPANFELKRSNRAVRLASRPMELLLLLVSRRGALVTREDIARALWPGLAVDDLDDRINTAIAQVRGALREDATRPRYIITVIGRGYRFSGEIEEVAEPAAAALQNGQIKAAPVESPPDSDSFSVPQAPSLDLLTATFESAAVRPAAHSSRNLALSAAALILLLSAGAIYQFKTRLAATSSAASWTVRQVTNNDSDHAVGASAISPDGLSLAYTDAAGIYLRELQTGRTHLLKGPALSATRLIWFNDGKRLVLTGFEHDQPRPDVWIVAADGADARLFRHNANDGAPSPDGSMIAFTADAGQSMHIANADGTPERTIARGNASRVFSALFWPVAGRRVNYQQRTPSGDPGSEIELNYQWSYCTVDIQSGVESVIDKDLPFDSAQETPDGKLFFLRSHPVKDTAHNGLWSANTDVATSRITSTPVRFYPIGSDLSAGMSISRDGKKIAAVQQHLYPYVAVADLAQPRLSLKNVRRLSSTLSSDYPYTLDAATDSLYFESDRADNKWHIFRQGVASPAAEMLTFGDKQQLFPTLMPDDKTLIYEEWSTVNGKKERAVNRADIDGSHSELVWKEHDLDEWRCPLKTGTNCVLRETEGQRAFVFYTLDLIRGKEKELARTSWEPTFLNDWALSPDGTTAAIPTHDPQSPSIRFVPLTAVGFQREVPLHEAALLSEIHYSADARGFFVEAQIGLHNQLQYISLTGDVHLLREATGYTWGLPSKDGKKLAFADSTISRNISLWQ